MGNNKSLVKTAQKNDLSTRPSGPLARPQHGVPSLREVNVPAPVQDSNVIVAYKDLNQPERDSKLAQRKHLIIAVFVFIVLGLGIMMGQHFSKSRNVATAEMSKLIPAGAEMTQSEHYHYDKSCYTGENGEQVCMTRTSQAR